MGSCLDTDIDPALLHCRHIEQKRWGGGGMAEILIFFKYAQEDFSHPGGKSGGNKLNDSLYDLDMRKEKYGFKQFFCHKYYIKLTKFKDLLCSK